MTVVNQTKAGSVSFIEQPSSKAGLVAADPFVVEVTADDTHVSCTIATLVGINNASFIGDILECV